MEQITLKGGAIYYTKDNTTAYRVLRGSVLIYLIPVNNGRDGRRLLLKEVTTDFVIPGFYHKSDLFGEWRFGLVAMDEAAVEAEEEAATDELRLEFAKKIKAQVMDISEYDEMVIEKYQLIDIKEKGYIYAARREKERTKEKSLRLIYDVFSKEGKTRSKTVATETGRPLYDAAAAICLKEKISIAPLERVMESCGKRFRIEDISRVSHFVTREIVLEPGWHHKDTGSVLCFEEESRSPVACIPKGSGRYIIYDPKTGKTDKLTDERAKALSAQAYMFYRPFPYKAMTKMDLFKFGMEKVKKADLVRFFVLALIGTLIGLMIPYMNEQAYDNFIPLGNASGLLQIGAVLLACMLGNVAFTIVKNLASFRFMNSMEYAVQSATFDRLFNLPESFFRDYDSAEIGQRALGITTIYDVLAQSLVTSLLSAVMSILYLWRMFQYSSSMSWIALFMLLLVIVFNVIMGLIQLKVIRKKQEIDMEAQSITFQLLGGISKIRNTFSEDRALLRYMEKNIDSTRLNKKLTRYGIAVNAVLGAVPVIFSMVFFYMMIRQNIELSIGAYSGFSAAFGAFSSAIFGVVGNIMTVNQIKPLYELAKPILETLPEMNEESVMPGDIKGEIEISNVTFGYDGADNPVLKDFNLHINPGEYIGIVGASGCGKSTLLKLLLGFEKPQFGKIYYDHKDMDDLDKRELRKKFGVVLQDGGMIYGSIYENITIASPGVKMKRVEETIREVGLEDDIKHMPMGLHTIVAEGAGTISGGQAQRILIARAIVGKPKLIFLDEATSALDNVTQSQIVDTLEKLKATKVVIAHRLSTVQNCDRIIVMNKGTIVEQGNYEELMAEKGLFYNLAMRQIS